MNLSDMRNYIIIILVFLVVIASVIPLLSTDVFKREVEEYLWLRNVEYSVESINDSHVVLNFSLSFERSETIEAISLMTKVFDARTGILLEKREISLKNTSKGLDFANVKLTFEKSGNYRVRFEAYREEDLLFRKDFGVSGLTSLIPENRRLLMEMKDTDFLVTGETSNKVSVKMRFYIYSMEEYSDILFHIKAVQLESNLLANESWKEFGVIEPGKTVLLETEMDIPKDYNYIVRVEAWRDEMLLKKWDSPLKLSPKEIIPEKVKEKEVELNISEFVREYPEEKYPYPVPTPVPTITPAPAPGFELYLALAAVIFALLIKRRGGKGGK